ncbi:CHAT domain-containing protein [Candidatus Scalindua japonica]|uniref:CHAT domain-containing protein n=1 Tax=Candidatus Scalindua japonica TaxID=1284222 RepID=UPI0013A544B6|nr:CHAT domain-containing protein [Candidatus Scalindua japonica]
MIIEDLKYDCGLVITHLNIPIDNKSPLNEDEKRGFVFLKWLENEKHNIPSILISDASNPELYNAAQKIAGCKLVPTSEKMEDDLLEFAKKELGTQEEKKEKRKIVNLDINLNFDQNAGSYVLKGVGFPYEDHGNLKIDLEMMEDLVKRSRNIEDIRKSRWEEELQAVGKILIKEIFVKNRTLHEHFYAQIGKGIGIENAKIRFLIEKGANPIFLEALYSADEISNNYWMLETPITRRLQNVETLGYPLFHDDETNEGPINCLIIEADSHGFVGMKDEEGEDMVLPELKNIEYEADFLHEFFCNSKESVKTGKVFKIECSHNNSGSEIIVTKNNKEYSYKFSAENSFEEYVENILKSETWHLVHFAGHSFCDQKGNGFVFFPGKAKSPIPIEITDFAKLLRVTKCRFIYLSSCHSSNEDFVFELARNKVPSAIGFRWKIDDDKAKELAKIFYEYLFKLKSLEYALLEARTKMRKLDSDNKIWAAPMLIMQMGD